MDDPEPSPDPSPRRYLALGPLARALGLAGDARKLILATLGLLALGAGWAGLDRAFGDAAGPPPIRVRLGLAMDDFPGPGTNAPVQAALHVAEPARVVVGPVAALFDRGTTFRAWSRSALMALWAVAVWGVAGGAIARVAVVQATTGGRVGLGTAARFAFRRAFPLIGAPLTPLLVAALFAIGCAGFGLVLRVPGGVGSTVAVIFGFLPLLAALVMALILGGLAVGWPLMIATVAAEGEDAPDALSRSYSYVNQRLVKTLVHVAAAWAIGAAGLIAATLLARVVLALAAWGVGLGAPAQSDADATFAGWAGLVGLLVHAWVYAYFWSAAAILYLILRRDVDGTDWHDVYLPEQDADTFAPEPPAAAAVEAEAG